MSAPAVREAQCPECWRWSPVVWIDNPPPGGFWWADSGGCPHCGALICVESECAFRGDAALRDGGER